MIGKSEAFRLLEQLIARMAPSDAPVLIEGETGTGKELAARAIHYGSARHDCPFVPVNCGALPDQLVENELFGHRRGAFTDAREDRPGLVTLAQGGTLFLDEVDALSAKVQVTLLRFLHDQQFRPLGGQREQRADVRVIAASNRSLDDAVKAGQFRLDLLYRLKVMYLRMPPLRERHGDPALLAEHFVRVGSVRFGKAQKPLAASTLDWFERYSWPGNIRELEHLVYREFLLTDAPDIVIVPPGQLAARDAAPLDYKRAKTLAIETFECHFLTRLIARANGNVSAAARICGTERRHLGRLLKKYQIGKPPLGA